MEFYKRALERAETNEDKYKFNLSIGMNYLCLVYNYIKILFTNLLFYLEKYNRIRHLFS